MLGDLHRSEENDMAEASMLLRYESEKEYLNDNLHNILMQICHNEGKCFEADSEDEFRSGHLISKQRAKFPTWVETDESPSNIGSYFSDIVNWVEQSSKESAFGEAGREQLEQWLTVKSCKINDRNIYIMAPCHPMVCLNDQHDQRLRDRFNAVAVRYSIEWMIKKAVLQDYLRINENFYVYGTGQVYFSVRKDGYRQAIPWADVGTLTPISSTRLIEKTRSWIIRNCDGANESPDVRIACIGTVTEEETIFEYYQKNPVTLQNGKKVYPRVTLTRLKQVPRREKYIFERQDNIENSKKIYNIASLSDMKELFGNFQIVLFLDESYFYRQRQTAKSLLEKGAAGYVAWCQKELEHELAKEPAEDEKEKRRNYYCSQIYNRTGLWLNGYGKADTSKLGFDSNLFSMIIQALNSVCDVYLYISRGKTIGSLRLPVQSICNDERYDGKQLLVYRVTEKKETVAGNDGVSKAIGKMLEDSEVLASIDLWKLVKSIGREFRAELFNDYSKDASVICEQINLLKRAILHVTVQEKDDAKPKLRFYLQCQAMEDGKADILKRFVLDYLKICTEEQEFTYVKNYLYNLLTAAIVARADSAKGVFYAYLMKKRTLVDVDAAVYEGITLPKQESDDSLFRARRTIYSAIQGLDQIMVRDMEKRLSILKYEFRHKYCSDVNEETFLLLLDKINEYCIKAKCIESPLYLLTKKTRGEMK